MAEKTLFRTQKIKECYKQFCDAIHEFFPEMELPKLPSKYLHVLVTVNGEKGTGKFSYRKIYFDAYGNTKSCSVHADAMSMTNMKLLNTVEELKDQLEMLKKNFKPNNIEIYLTVRNKLA